MSEMNAAPRWFGHENPDFDWLGYGAPGREHLPVHAIERPAIRLRRFPQIHPNGNQQLERKLDGFDANRASQLDNFKGRIGSGPASGSMAAGQARVEAQKHAEELAKRLQLEQARQEKAAAQMKTELTEAVTNVEKTATTKIGEVSAEVGNVKTEVQTAKSELDKTIQDLKRVRGDLDGTSSLVATNGKELTALRSLGERNYFEFNITKSKEPRSVGDVAVVLKKTDPKRNRFTIELLADDKRVEKKDKNLNEPVQFYVSKARQPYEIVVNEVKKDQIVGYLATPKVQTSRN